MDPVTFAVVTYVLAYFASEKVRGVTHGTARTAWGGLRRLFTSGGAKTPAASPSGGSASSRTTPPPQGPRRPRKTTRPTPKAASPRTPTASPDEDTPRRKPMSLRGRPKDPDKPSFGHPVKTTRTTVTTIRPATTNDPGVSPVTSPSPSPAPSSGTSPSPSSGKHAAPSGDGTVSGGAEKIPAHMDASDKAAAALEKVVAKFRQLAQMSDTGESGKSEIRQVITNASAAEKLHIIREPLAAHKEAASSAHAALAAIARFQEAAAAVAAAVADCEERAKGAARLERQALSTTVEAVRSAPIADPAHAGSLRG